MKKKGTEAVVTKLPQCDFCSVNKAQFDVVTKYGPWAYVCDTCFYIHTNVDEDKLGTGVGQRLVVA